MSTFGSPSRSQIEVPASRVVRRQPGTAVATRRQPLLYLYAHWTLRAHRRYLEAANFHWQR